MGTYFVNNSTGNNANAGTRSSPWQTAAFALTTIADGDTMVLVFTGSAYDFVGTISKNCTVVGAGTTQPTITGGTVGTNRLVVAGATVKARNLILSGATTTGISGVRVQEGGRLELVNCSSTGNDRAFTVESNAELVATDCAFTGNTALAVVGASSGEFTRCTGMPANTVDTRGTRDRSGTVHIHSYLRGGNFYAAPEFYVPGTRSVWVATTGVTGTEGTEGAPLPSIYEAIRLPGARVINVENGTYNEAELKLEGFIVDIIGKADVADAPVIITSSGTYGFHLVGSRVKLHNLRITGATQNGINLRQAVAELHRVELSGNGVNGLDAIQGSVVTGEDCTAHNNGVDGFGLHRQSVATFTRCTAYNNTDDGFSPHDGSVMTLIDCTARDNTDRGAVAVLGSQLDITGGSYHGNGNQNLSWEDAGTTGEVTDVVAYGPVGGGAVNARVINNAAVEFFSLRDNTGALITPTTSGGGTATIDLDDRDYLRREVINANG